jgi:hypothetical protein
MRHRYFEARVATCSSNEISVLLSHLYIISVLLSHLYIKMNILPRQARDKHSENSKKESVLSLSGQTQKSHQHVELCCVVSCRVVSRTEWKVPWAVRRERPGCRVPPHS